MTKKEPYIWLQENEEGGRAVCGCELRTGSTGPSLWFCPLHNAAPKLLRACKLAKEALDLNDEFGNDINRRRLDY